MNEQRSQAWFKEREGKVTASTFGQAAGLGPGSRQQAWRRLKGLEVFEGNEATQWGETHEPVALEAYQKHVAQGKVALTGFVLHPEHAWLGGSPDFLIDEDGIGEIKCPFSMVRYPEVPAHYMAQVQGLLEITNRSYCDFVCWTPEAMSVTRIQRSPDYWGWLHIKLADFWCWVAANLEPPRQAKTIVPEIQIQQKPVSTIYF